MTQNPKYPPITSKQVTEHMNLVLTERYHNCLPHDAPSNRKKGAQVLRTFANERAKELGYMHSSNTLTFAGREYVENLLNYKVLEA